MNPYSDSEFYDGSVPKYPIEIEDLEIEEHDQIRKDRDAKYVELEEFAHRIAKIVEDELCELLTCPEEFGGKVIHVINEMLKFPFPLISKMKSIERLGQLVKDDRLLMFADPSVSQEEKKMIFESEIRGELSKEIFEELVDKPQDLLMGMMWLFSGFSNEARG